MFLSFNTRKDASTLKYVAALMLSIWLAPSVFMAMSPDDAGKRWVFVCGSLQSKWLALDAEQTPDGEAVNQNECPLCGLFKLYSATPNSDVLLEIVELLHLGQAADDPQIPHIVTAAEFITPRGPPFFA